MKAQSKRAASLLGSIKSPKKSAASRRNGCNHKHKVSKIEASAIIFQRDKIGRTRESLMANFNLSQTTLTRILNGTYFKPRKNRIQ